VVAFSGAVQHSISYVRERQRMIKDFGDEKVAHFDRLAEVEQGVTA
jgi:hypothetical protein